MMECYALFERFNDTFLVMNRQLFIFRKEHVSNLKLMRVVVVVGAYLHIMNLRWWCNLGILMF